MCTLTRCTPSSQWTWCTDFPLRNLGSGRRELKYHFVSKSRTKFEGLLIRHRLLSKEGVNSSLHVHFPPTQYVSLIDEHCSSSSLQESPIFPAPANITLVLFLWFIVASESISMVAIYTWGMHWLLNSRSRSIHLSTCTSCRHHRRCTQN